MANSEQEKRPTTPIDRPVQSMNTYDNEAKEQHDNDASGTTQPSKRSWHFWLVFLSLCVISFLSALDGSIITTALPTITDVIGGAEQYVWIANCFVLASTVVQPVCAQLCNIFGRRNPMIISVALFALGSGIAGGANGVTMLIVGRTVQGVGSGGIYMLVDLIVCDLVSLRERGKYLGMMLSTAAVGAILGPVLGGLLAEADWRWVFYINLPISGLVLIVMVIFLRVKHQKEPTWKAALARVDWIGNIIFIASICAVLLGLVMGGAVFPWSSWRIIVPFVLGFAGWAIFHIYESSRFCKEPSMPPQLFANRTSSIGFFLAFDAAMLLQWTIYYLPIYFQGVLQTTPLTSGVNLLPFNAFIIPAAMLAGGLMSKTGLYRPLHGAGFALVALGIGLFTIMTADTHTALWVVFQMFGAIGQGFLIPTILPAIQASLPVSEVATATGTYAFVRSFGFIWGVTIPGVIFTGQFNRYSSLISDEAVRGSLANGRAYGYASGIHRTPLPDSVRAEVVGVYSAALKTVWQVGITFALLGFVAAFGHKHVELKTDLETEFGLETERKTTDQNEAGSPQK